MYEPFACLVLRACSSSKARTPPHIPLPVLVSRHTQHRPYSVGKDVLEKARYLEILASRRLIDEEFKESVLNLYQSKKINEAKFFENLERSISGYEGAEFKILSIDEDMFKLKNDELEYVGEVDRMPNDKTELSSNRGKVSYYFIKQLREQLKYRVLTLKEINALNDICLKSDISRKEVNSWKRTHTKLRSTEDY